MKKLFLLFNGRFPSEKAAALFAARSAEAFVHAGFEVTLIVPKRREYLGTAAEIYMLPSTVTVIYVSGLDLFQFPLPRILAYWVQTVSFSFSSFFYLLSAAKPADIIYSNEPLPLLCASLRFPQTIYEMHDFPESKKFFFSVFLHRMKRLVIHNEWKTNQTIEEFRIPKSKILTEQNAVNAEAFNPPYTQEEARGKLGIPKKGIVIVYTGHLYGWKGVDTLAKTALTMKGIEFYFVGGTPEDRAQYQETYNASNLHWIGHKLHTEIPYWQRAADVVVLPNTAKEAISARYTSPMKLFEYAASGTPIVASKLPSIEEIVDESMVKFAEADNPESFVSAIQEVLRIPKQAHERSLMARKMVAAHTWNARAERIRKFIELS